MLALLDSFSVTVRFSDFCIFPKDLFSLHIYLYIFLNFNDLLTFLLVLVFLPFLTVRFATFCVSPNEFFTIHVYNPLSSARTSLITSELSCCCSFTLTIFVPSSRVFMSRNPTSLSRILPLDVFQET